jgi:hypothetical protein
VLIEGWGKGNSMDALLTSWLVHQDECFTVSGSHDQRIERQMCGKQQSLFKADRESHSVKGE